MKQQTETHLGMKCAIACTTCWGEKGTLIIKKFCGLQSATVLLTSTGMTNNTCVQLSHVVLHPNQSSDVSTLCGNIYICREAFHVYPNSRIYISEKMRSNRLRSRAQLFLYFWNILLFKFLLFKSWNYSYGIQSSK